MSGGHAARRRPPQAPRARHGGGGHEGGDERWLLTYADMITLLMALFMVLWSISSVNISKYQVLQHVAAEGVHRRASWTAASGVQQRQPDPDPGRPDRDADAARSTRRFNIFTHTLIGSKTNPAAKAKAAAKEQNTLLEVQRKVEDYAQKHGFANDISTTIDQRGLVIRLLTEQGAVRQRRGDAQADRRRRCSTASRT